MRQRFQNFVPTGIHNWFQQVLCAMGGDLGKEQKAHAHLTPASQEGGKTKDKSSTARSVLIAHAFATAEMYNEGGVFVPDASLAESR